MNDYKGGDRRLYEVLLKGKLESGSLHIYPLFTYDLHIILHMYPLGFAGSLAHRNCQVAPHPKSSSPIHKIRGVIILPDTHHTLPTISHLACPAICI